MKKTLIALLAMIMLSSTAVYASNTPVSDWINGKTQKITQKEQSANAKAAANRKKQQEKVAKERAKQAEARKKQQEKIAKERQKAAAKRAEDQKKAAEHKQKVQNKKKQLKDLFTVD